MINCAIVLRLFGDLLILSPQSSHALGGLSIHLSMVGGALGRTWPWLSTGSKVKYMCPLCVHAASGVTSSRTASVKVFMNEVIRMECSIPSDLRTSHNTSRQVRLGQESV